jgi:ATP-dependent DNA helicase RecQ
LRHSAPQAPRRGRQRGNGGTIAGPGKGSIVASGAQQVLFEALREWRRTTAREHNVPAYTVFHDTTLAEIARRLPQSALQLRGIAGVGEAKLSRYGIALLELVRQHAQA